MPDFAAALGASKAASSLLVLFIPSRDRGDQPIDQRHWVEESLTVLGTLFGGATAFPQGRGVWRDSTRAASCFSTSRWSFNATRASIGLSSR